VWAVVDHDAEGGALAECHYLLAGTFRKVHLFLFPS
jgi:hypothetical protein